jgi:hypothetical protein
MKERAAARSQAYIVFEGDDAMTIHASAIVLLEVRQQHRREGHGAWDYSCGVDEIYS